jgi:hypothetical protein
MRHAILFQSVKPQVSSRAATAALVGGIAFFAVLYLASIGPYWNISPDSASYVGWGRSLAAGQGWGQPPVNPPLTALVFASVLLLFPTGYWALNALNVGLLLVALSLAAGPIIRRLGRNAGLLVVLLAIASTKFYAATGRLLSEPIYLAVSLGALWLLDGETRESPQRPGWKLWLAGLLLVATVMTRTIGVTLPLAVLLVQWMRWRRAREKPSLVLFGWAIVALAGGILWEVYTGQGYAAGWFRMVEGIDPWVPDSPGSSVADLFARTWRNLPGLLQGGTWLLNKWTTGSRIADLAVSSLGTVAVIAGLVWYARGKAAFVEWYVALYLVIVGINRLAGGDGDFRFLLPVLPFLICYPVLAAQRLLDRSEGAKPGTWSRRMLLGAAAVGTLWFVRAGWNTIIPGIVAVHSSPFGDYPIKRPQNFDAQRLAFWLRDHTGPEERYASGQRDMFDVLTERRGHDLVVGRLAPRERFLAWLAQGKVRYLLVDRTTGLGDSLLVVVREYPEVFLPIRTLPGASLYQVRPR